MLEQNSRKNCVVVLNVPISQAAIRYCKKEFVATFAPALHESSIFQIFENERSFLCHILGAASSAAVSLARPLPQLSPRRSLCRNTPWRGLFRTFLLNAASAAPVSLAPPRPQLSPRRGFCRSCLLGAASAAAVNLPDKGRLQEHRVLRKMPLEHIHAATSLSGKRTV